MSNDTRQLDAMATDATASTRRRHPLVLALHLVGYALGLALMVYCVRTAVQGNAVEHLRSASIWQVAGLFVCSFVSISAHGAAWWLLMLPIVRLSFNRVQAINAIASLLFYAPAKLSVISRVALHRRADKLGYGRLAAWFIAMTACMGVAFGVGILPALLVGVEPWLRLAVVAVVAAAGVVFIVVVARFHLVGKLLRGSEKMLVFPHIVAGAVLLRLVDVLAMSLRLQIACDVLGRPISLWDAGGLTVLPLVGTAMSPIGALGAREWLTGLLGRFLEASEQTTFQSAATVATAAEAGTLVILALIGLAVVRPHRRFEQESPPASEKPASEAGPADKPGPPTRASLDN